MHYSHVSIAIMYIICVHVSSLLYFSDHDGTQIHSTNPLTPIVSYRDTGYYEDVGDHEYAVLEPHSLPEQSSGGLTVLSDTSAVSTEHEYFFLDHLQKESNIQLGGVTQEVMNLGDLGSEGLYSSLDNPHHEYAVLELESGNGALVPDPGEYSHLQETTGRYLVHDYQRVLPVPSTDYDRTFSNNIPEHIPG